MIIGIGTDLIETARIRASINNKKFIERILTKTEQDLFYSLSSSRRKEEFLTGRFAAKEAYAKARGTGIGAELSWRDIMILNDDKGKPILKEQKGSINHVHVSITHTKEYAAAFVILESLSG